MTSIQIINLQEYDENIKTEKLLIIKYKYSKTCLRYSQIYVILKSRLFFGPVTMSISCMYFSPI